MNYFTNVARIGFTLLVLFALSAFNTTEHAPAAAKATMTPLTTVVNVDMQRYLGTWYQQASVPNNFQATCVSDTQATYITDGDGLVVVNQCRRADGYVETVKGVGKIVEGSNNARLRVSFFRPFYDNYWVLALDPNYAWVLVGEPTREYGWVFSRGPKLDEATLNQILDRAVVLGYDRSAFKRSLQGARL